MYAGFNTFQNYKNAGCGGNNQGFMDFSQAKKYGRSGVCAKMQPLLPPLRIAIEKRVALYAYTLFS